MASTLRDLVQLWHRRFQERGVDSPRLSAELLAAHALGMDRLRLFCELSRPLTEEELRAVERLALRRAEGEPVAYILGRREFFGRDFAVSPAVLVPRPETEHIVERVLELFAPDEPFTFADFGTGSGCLAVTIAAERPLSRGLAIDLSADALDVALSNARAHGVEHRLALVRADFTRPLLGRSVLDLAVSNPPYVSDAEYAELSGEVRDHEPRTALVSPDHGLAHARALLPIAAHALRPGAELLVEIGCTQGPALLDMVRTISPAYDPAMIISDLAGHDRVVSARRAAM